MSIDGAVVREQGVTFAVVIVKPHVLNTSSGADEARAGFRRYFPSMPLVLAAQDSRGRFEYQGRRDIVDFLASISASRIPWKKYSFS